MEISPSSSERAAPSLDFCHFMPDLYVKYAGSRGWRTKQSGTVSLRLCAFFFVLKHWQGCQELISGCAQWENLPEELLELVFLSSHTKRSQKDRVIPNVRCRFISPYGDALRWSQDKTGGCRQCHTQLVKTEDECGNHPRPCSPSVRQSMSVLTTGTQRAH